MSTLTRALVLFSLLSLLAPLSLAQAPAPATLDESKLPPAAKAFARSARLGAEWLFQGNEVDGRFRPGVNPLLNLPLPDEGFIPQAEAALALGQAGRLFNEERYTLRAKQALLSLLSQTEMDSKNPKVRIPSVSAREVNHAAAASLLVWAVCEVQNPPAELLQPAEELANYLRTLQMQDGSFMLGEQPKVLPHQNAATMEQRHLATHGLILIALLKSHARQPAAWKLEATKTALNFYRSRWQANPMPGPTNTLMIALADAYRQTKEKPFAEAVVAMCDWTLARQYQSPNCPALFDGGFMGWKDGKLDPIAPTLETACEVEGLAAAMLVLRELNDVNRLEKGATALTKACQFLATQQFQVANTGQFTEEFRPLLLGSYFTGPENGCNSLGGSARTVRALLTAIATP